MKKLAYKTVVSVLIVVLSAACRKDEPVDPNNGKPEEVAVGTLDLGSTLSADFQGRVTDENNQAVSGVLITAGTKTTYTDANGFFVIKNANVYEKLAYITAEKSGYFLGSRSVIPTQNSSNTILIQLLTLNVTATISSGSSATVSLTDGASIDFEGYYKDPNGNPYNGSVTVSAKYLAPGSPQTFEQMPGMLYAQSEEGSAGALVTYGMIAVELFGSGGQPLQLASGSTATLHMPVDAQQAADAPASIPLWFFDEVAGYWIEEGEAILVDGEYVGEVSHFTFWNCDAFYESCLLNGQVLDAAGNPAGNSSILVETGGMTSMGITNPDGSFYTYLASNSTATITIGYNCGGTTEYVVGPYSTNADVTETFELTSPITVFTLTGTLVNCDSQPVTDADLYLYDNFQYYSFHVEDGVIDFEIPNCGMTATTMQMFVYDYNQPFTTFSGTTISTITSSFDLGQVTICDTVTISQDTTGGSFIDLHIDGNPVMFATGIHFEFSDSTAEFDYVILSPSETNYVFIGSGIDTPGNYPGTSWTPLIQGEMIFMDGYQIDSTCIMNMNTEMIVYEGPGGIILFYISGTYTDYLGGSHFVEATVQADIPI